MQTIGKIYDSGGNKGYAILITLLVITLLIIIVFSIVSLNESSLYIARSVQFKAMSIETARAGMADAIYQLYDNPAWTAGFASKTLPNNLGNYSMTFTAGSAPYSTNNYAGSSSVIGYEGRTIPADYIHLVSIGTYNNRTKKAQTLMQVALAGPFFNNVLLAQNDITVNRGFLSDSFDSSLGTYAATQQNSDGHIKTNGTANDVVSISGTGGSPSVVNGNVIVGVGADPNSAIKTTGAVTINGSKQAQAFAMQFPQITAASGSQDLLYTGGTNTLAPGSYRDLTIRGGAVLTLTGTQYAFRNVTLGTATTNGFLRILSSSSPVTVYLTGNFNIRGGAIRNQTLKSNYLVFYGTDTALTVDLKGGTQAYFAFYARGAVVTLKAGGVFYGAFAGSQTVAQNNVNIHFDKALRLVEVPGYDTTSKHIIIKSSW